MANTTRRLYPWRMNEPLRIDIVSDVMCPWCIVGYRQLAIALKRSDIAHTIHWHPFELNPAMPPEGQNLREHLAEKYGVSPEQSAQNRARLKELGRDLGFTFNFSEDSRMHNTFSAHQLLHWAGPKGLKHELKQALFEAHFSDARDLSDIAVLAEVAASVGLDGAEALEVLRDQRFAPDVRNEQALWIQRGIRGVPAVVFNEEHLVTGAQGIDGYAQVLSQLAGEA